MTNIVCVFKIRILKLDICGKWCLSFILIYYALLLLSGVLLLYTRYNKVIWWSSDIDKHYIILLYTQERPDVFQDVVTECPLFLIKFASFNPWKLKKYDTVLFKVCGNNEEELLQVKPGYVWHITTMIYFARHSKLYKYSPSQNPQFTTSPITDNCHSFSSPNQASFF